MLPQLLIEAVLAEQVTARWWIDQDHGYAVAREFRDEIVARLAIDDPESVARVRLVDTARGGDLPKLG